MLVRLFFFGSLLALIGNLGFVSGGASVPRWTWLSGSSDSVEAGTYSTGSTATPGSRYGSTVWAVKDWTVPGEFPLVYVFSGFGFGADLNSIGFLKDMWVFNTSSNQWTWIMGPSTTQGNPEVTGYQMNSTFVQRNAFNPGYIPDARMYTCSFSYNEELFVYSGRSSSSGSIRAYADLWKFNQSLQQWSWISGSLGVNVSGVDGVFQDTSNDNSYPGSLYELTCWNPVKDKFFVYEGATYIANTYFLSDRVWQFDLTTLRWSWVRGSPDSGPKNPFVSVPIWNYESSANTPGTIFGALPWTSKTTPDLLYFYGGKLFVGENEYVILRNLFAFNITSLMWRIVSQFGFSEAFSDDGLYSVNASLGARSYAATWTSEAGTLFAYGGDILNSSGTGISLSSNIWEYDLSLGDWRVFKTPFFANYDQKGLESIVSAPGVVLNSAESSNSYKNYHFLFGGRPITNSSITLSNVLWQLRTCSSNVIFDSSSNRTVDCFGCSYGQEYDAIQRVCQNCSPGKFNFDFQETCQECPVGRLSEYSGGTSCSDCPSGKISDIVGSSSCSFCAPGSIASSSGKSNCEPCSLGKYAFNTLFCEDCSPGKYANSTGLSFCYECSPGEYSLNSSLCEQCPIGKFSVDPSEGCMDCLGGKISVEPGSSTCASCDSGKYSLNTSICEVCPVGRYSELGWSECMECPVARVSKGSGASSCESCKPGEFITEDSSCAMCPIGRYSEDGSCFDCPKGRIANSTGSSTCYVCPLGHISINAASCSACKPGSFANSSESSCFSCEFGYIAPEYGSANCAVCAAGSIYKNSTLCEECPPGKFSSAERSTTCSDCSGGKFADGFGNSICISCAAGRFNDVGSSICSACPEGKFSRMGSSECMECDAGRYSPSVGLSSCAYCSKSYYADSTGLSTCAQCPPNAVTVFEGSEAVSSCICDQGFWGRAFLNESCSRCNPYEGSSCALNSSVPYVLNGFYRDKANPDAVFRCIPSQACRASGFGQTECETGYTGELCSECVQFEYYRKDLECIECPSPLVTVLLVSVLVVAFGFVSYRVMITRARIPLEARICISSLQIVSLFPSLASEWPNAMLSMFRITSFTNFNLDLFSPECSVSISFWGKLLLKLFVPVIVAVWIAIAFVVISKVRRVQVQNQGLMSRNQVIAFFVFLLSVFFTVLASTCLSIFNCSQVENLKFVSNYDPSVECFDGTWWRYFGIVFFLSMIYLVAFPAFMVYNFWKYRANPADDRFLSLFSSITVIYKPECFYWEIFCIVKKIVFVISSDFLSYNRPQSTRLFLTIFFLFIFFAVESWKRPYSSEVHNQFNLAWNISSILILLSSFVFQSADVSTRDKSIFTGLMITVMTVMILWTLQKILTMKVSRRRPKKATTDPVRTTELSPTTAVQAISGHISHQDKV